MLQIAEYPPIDVPTEDELITQTLGWVKDIMRENGHWIPCFLAWGTKKHLIINMSMGEEFGYPSHVYAGMCGHILKIVDGFTYMMVAETWTISRKPEGEYTGPAPSECPDRQEGLMMIIETQTRTRVVNYVTIRNEAGKFLDFKPESDKDDDVVHDGHWIGLLRAHQTVQ